MTPGLVVIFEVFLDIAGWDAEAGVPVIVEEGVPFVLVEGSGVAAATIALRSLMERAGLTLFPPFLPIVVAGIEIWVSCCWW